MPRRSAVSDTGPRSERDDSVPDAHAPGFDDVEVDAEVELLAVAQAAVALDPCKRVERAHARVGILRRHGAARHRPGHAHDRLADPYTLPRVLLVRDCAVELEQHPEAPSVDLGAELFAEPRARCPRD